MIFEAIRQGDAEQVRALLAAKPELALLAHARGRQPVLWSSTPATADSRRCCSPAAIPISSRPVALGDTDAPRNSWRPIPSCGSILGDGFTGSVSPLSSATRKWRARCLTMGGMPRSLRATRLDMPLHSACASGSVEIVKLLLEHRADANALEGNGLTPLHTAAGIGNREIVALFLRRAPTPRCEPTMEAPRPTSRVHTINPKSRGNWITEPKNPSKAPCFSRRILPSRQRRINDLQGVPGEKTYATACAFSLSSDSWKLSGCKSSRRRSADRVEGAEVLDAEQIVGRDGRLEADLLPAGGCRRAPGRPGKGSVFSWIPSTVAIPA